MKKFGKKWIKMNDDVQTEEVSEEVKEEKEMGFFGKHKKGLIIGGLSALAAGAAGLLICTNRSSDDDEDYDDFDDLTDDEADSDESEEA